MMGDKSCLESVPRKSYHYQVRECLRWSRMRTTDIVLWDDRTAACSFSLQVQYWAIEGEVSAAYHRQGGDSSGAVDCAD